MARGGRGPGRLTASSVLTDLFQDIKIRISSEGIPFDVFAVFPKEPGKEPKLDNNTPSGSQSTSGPLQPSGSQLTAGTLPTNGLHHQAGSLPEPPVLSSPLKQHTFSVPATTKTPLKTPVKLSERRALDYPSPSCAFRSPFKSPLNSPYRSSPYKSPFKRKLSFGLPSSPDLNLDFLCGLDDSEGIAELFDMW